MDTIFVTNEISPFTQDSPRARMAEKLIKALKPDQNNITVFVPFPAKTDPSVNSLAKRLMPIKATVNGAEIKCSRYDGRTSEGAEVLLLDIPDTDAPALEAFFAGAKSLMKALKEPAEAIIALGPAASFLNKVADITTASCRIALFAPDDHAPKEIPGADRIVTLGTSDLSGETVISLPLPCDQVIHVPDKPSAKSAFQLKTGLPVQRDLPLLVFPTATTDTLVRALGELLSHDVQVAVRGANEPIQTLAGRYSDRLVIVEDTISPSELLAAADACVTEDDIQLTLTALSAQTVPIVGPACAELVVDLEPSLKTGSGICVSPFQTAALKEAFGRFLSAFSQRTAFSALTARFPSYPTGWKKTGAQLRAVVTEIQLEK